MPHPACVVAGVVTLAYLLALAAIARAHLDQAQQAKRSLPDPIRSVALSYAAKAKN